MRAWEILAWRGMACLPGRIQSIVLLSFPHAHVAKNETPLLHGVSGVGRGTACVRRFHERRAATSKSNLPGFDARRCGDTHTGNLRHFSPLPAQSAWNEPCDVSVCAELRRKTRLCFYYYKCGGGPLLNCAAGKWVHYQINWAVNQLANSLWYKFAGRAALQQLIWFNLSAHTSERAAADWINLSARRCRKIWHKNSLD